MKTKIMINMAWKERYGLAKNPWIELFDGLNVIQTRCPFHRIFLTWVGGNGQCLLFVLSNNLAKTLLMLEDLSFIKQKFLLQIFLLNLGCGNGQAALELAAEGFQKVLGVDYSAAAVRLASKIAEQRDIQNVKFKVCFTCPTYFTIRS